MRNIPINEGRMIAERYGYDQVIIYARKVDRPAGIGETAKSEIKGGEHMTTYGINKVHCEVAARIGDHLKYKIMGWTKESAETCERAPHKVMTPEEYAAMPIIGWHEVCRDIDGFGGVGIRFFGETPR